MSIEPASSPHLPSTLNLVSIHCSKFLFSWDNTRLTTDRLYTDWFAFDNALYSCHAEVKMICIKEGVVWKSERPSLIFWTSTISPRRGLGACVPAFGLYQGARRGSLVIDGEHHLRSRMGPDFSGAFVLPRKPGNL